jgi:ribonuclease G
VDAFRGSLRSDRARTKILNVSDLGLVEMTRQRVRPSVYHYMSETCPYCGGMGQVYSFGSMKVKLERWARRVSADASDRRVRFHVHPDHARRFEAEEAVLLKSLEQEAGIQIEIRGDPGLGREEIRVFSAERNEDITERVGA